MLSTRPAIGNAVKWFPDRRGLAVGLTAAGFGAGAALTVVPIRAVIAAYGYGAAFFWFGLVQGAVVFVLAWALRAPFAGETTATAPPKVMQTGESMTPRAMLATPVFWVLYLMFVLVSASGLMATAQVALIARDFHVANTLVLAGMSTLTMALLVDNVANGAARPLFGWISDHIGREPTMAIAFGLGGVSYWLLGSLGTTPWAFVLFAGLIFLTWGEIFSLFPSTCTDSFGPKYATANLSFLYTAKGLSAFLVPVANLIEAATGSWHLVFVVTAITEFRRRGAGARGIAAAARPPFCADGAGSRRRRLRVLAMTIATWARRLAPAVVLPALFAAAAAVAAEIEPTVETRQATIEARDARGLRVRFEAANEPSLLFRPARGFWDWQATSKLVIPVDNPGGEPLTLRLGVDSAEGRSLAGQVTIAAGSTGNLAIWLEAPSPRAMGMVAGASLPEPGTLPLTATKGSVDAAHVAAVRLGIAHPVVAGRLIVGLPRVAPPSAAEQPRL